MLSTSKSVYAVRETLRSTKKDYAKTEDDLKSLQSVGQIIGEVLRPLDNERCNSTLQYSCFFWFFNTVCSIFTFLLVNYLKPMWINLVIFIMINDNRVIPFWI